MLHCCLLCRLISGASVALLTMAKSGKAKTINIKCFFIGDLLMENRPDCLLEINL